MFRKLLAAALTLASEVSCMLWSSKDSLVQNCGELSTDPLVALFAPAA